MDSSLTIHHTPDLHADTSTPDTHQDVFSKATLGFWVYLMSDCLIFTSLFTTFAVLHNNTFGGPSSQDIFNLPSAFIETMILLFSSVTCGFGVLSSFRRGKNGVLFWLFITFLLGVSFIGMELKEFSQLVEEGNSWERSAFLSSFFALVGTHGLHVSFGLLWLGVMFGQIFFFGITTTTFRRLTLFSLFWHFLDLVWIFIFTFVYLLGVV